MTIDDLAARVVAGERRALAKAITLVESVRDDHRLDAHALLNALHASSSSANGALRVGISGPPGVGKSTFIEAVGAMVLDAGKKVCVLAIDPSSPVTGGSILGDKTRMTTLSSSDRAFVRPSPSGGTLGGIAARTKEAMLVCEAAGFDVVIVETVGTGQSEHAVCAITDTFVVLTAPGGGDDLQGQKRGVMELTDILVVNKADGPRADEANVTANHYRSAFHLLHHGKAWQPPVLRCSAQEGSGLVEVWQAIEAHRAFIAPNLRERRAEQAELWLWQSVDHALARRARSDTRTAALRARLIDEVRAETRTASAAADDLLDALLR